jgi:hypothetical protein
MVKKDGGGLKSIQDWISTDQHVHDKEDHDGIDDHHNEIACYHGTPPQFPYL